jgi:macrolide-specific efflux system membrane fusion protein
VITVPVTALQFSRERGVRDDGRSANVTVVEEDGSREMHQVVVGVSDRLIAEIVSGLSEGEKVVADMRSATGTRGRQQQNFGGGGFGPGAGAGGGAFR